MERTISFVDESALKPIKSKAELLDMMSQCEQKKELVLSNLDLSEMDDCSCINFDRYRLDNIVFSRFRPEDPQKRHLFNLSFVSAELSRVSFAQAYLQQCNFDTMDVKAYALHYKKMYGQDMPEEKKDERIAKLNGVDFFFSDLVFCRFRNTVANTVDFRYAYVCDCTMSEFHVTLGDFYFCNFKGATNFIDSKFCKCSFTCATFENSCIRMVNIKDGIVQEDSKAYHEELINGRNWLRYNPCFSFSSMNKEANRGKNDISDLMIAGEAMNVYRQLSGMYAGKGLNRDSNEAYRMAKLKERDYYKLRIKAIKTGEIKMDKEKDHSLIYLRWIVAKTYITQMMGYGYKWTVPVVWFIILVILYALIYFFTNRYGGNNLPDWMEYIAYSMNNALSPFNEFYAVVNVLLSSIQSTIGILLVGFLGFVIANKIRNDS